MVLQDAPHISKLGTVRTEVSAHYVTTSPSSDPRPTYLPRGEIPRHRCSARESRTGLPRLQHKQTLQRYRPDAAPLL